MAEASELRDMGLTNLRLRNRHGESGGEFFVHGAGAASTLARIQRELTDYRAAEPNADWHMETRGTDRSWHRWKEGA